MASEQWLLNDTSVANNAYFTAVGSSYKLRNTTGSTQNRRTTSPSPYEGAGYYACFLGGPATGVFYTSGGSGLTGGTYYVDAYFYLTGYPSADLNTFVLTANDTNILYTWVQIDTDGSFSIGSYDDVNTTTVWTSSANSILPTSEWFRIQIKTSSKGVAEAKLFKGTGINGTAPDATLTKDFTTQFPFSSYGAFEALVIGTDGTGAGATKLYIDDIKFDDTAYPTRSTAHTASATATGTATGTAAMSNARVGAGTGTGTATGTAAASNQRTLAASATGTASGTAAMSSTQAMSASATATATGTAAGSITALITIDGAGTAAATGTAGASSTQLFAASATVTATGTAVGSIRPLVTVDGVGTITATGTSTASNRKTLAASATATATASASMLSIISVAAAGTATANATAAALITTPGSLYGNATKVAGLYGSSTKPTLTTRS